MNIKNNELNVDLSILDEILLAPAKQDRCATDEALSTAACSGQCKGPGGCFGSY